MGECFVGRLKFVPLFVPPEFFVAIEPDAGSLSVALVR